MLLLFTFHPISQPLPSHRGLLLSFFSRTMPGGSEAAVGLQLQFTHSKISLDRGWWDVTSGGNWHRGYHPLQQVCKSLHNAQTCKALSHKQSLQPWPRRPFMGIRVSQKPGALHLEVVYRHKEEHVTLTVSSGIKHGINYFVLRKQKPSSLFAPPHPHTPYPNKVEKTPSHSSSWSLNLCGCGFTIYTTCLHSSRVKHKDPILQPPLKNWLLKS